MSASFHPRRTLIFARIHASPKKFSEGDVPESKAVHDGWKRCSRSLEYATFRPTHHWTDQKLRVHALYCVIALMITSLLRRQLAKAGIPLSLARMRTLADIREVSLVYRTADAKSLRTQTILSDLSDEQKKILAALKLEQLRAP